MTASQVSAAVASVENASKKKQKSKNGRDTSKKATYRDSELQRSNISQLSSTVKKSLPFVASAKPASSKGQSISQVSHQSRLGLSEQEKLMAETGRSDQLRRARDVDGEEETKDLEQETIKSMSDQDYKEKQDSSKWASMSLTNRRLGETENSLRVDTN